MNLTNIVSTFSEMSNLFSPTKLTDKITKVAKKAGIKVIYAALLLYYTLMAGDVPTKDKAIVLGALGYFICPVDMIPDMLPGGFVDDGAALIYAVKIIWDNITPAIHNKARKQLTNWFGTISDSDLKLF